MNEETDELVVLYPFLRKGLVEYFEGGESLEDFLRRDDELYLGKASNLLLEIINRNETSFPIENPDRVSEFIVTKIILTYIRDYFISARYAIKERKALYDNFEKETDPKRIRLVSGELGVEIKEEEGRFLIPIQSFLKNAVVFNDKDLKLCNQELREGEVVASHHVLSKIIREAFYRKYMEEVNEIVRFPKNVEDLIKPYVSEIIAKGEEIRQERTYLGPLNLKAFPPCLEEVIDEMDKGANVSHPSRFFLVTFLHRIGLKNDEIFRYFGDVPDFAERITKYQIEHITGTGRGREYSVPSCQTLGSMGLCYKERDPLCNSGKINHPLNFYRIRNKSNRPVSKNSSVEGVDKS